MPITFSQPKISERNIFSNVKSKLEILVKQQDLFKTGSNTHILKTVFLSKQNLLVLDLLRSKSEKRMMTRVWDSAKPTFLKVQLKTAWLWDECKMNDYFIVNNVMYPEDIIRVDRITFKWGFWKFFPLVPMQS